MTAINVFVRQSVVHLITDAAFVSNDGVLRLIASKVRHLPHLNTIMVMRGALDLDMAFANGFSTAMRSFDHLLHEFTGSVQTIADAHAAENGPHNWELLVAGFSESYGIPTIVGAFHGETAGAPGIVFEQFSDWVAPMTPGIAERLTARKIDIDPGNFDVEGNGAALIDEQRREIIANGTVGEAIHCVGGFAQLTTLTAAGISTRVLARWDDKIGEKIRP